MSLNLAGVGQAGGTPRLRAEILVLWAMPNLSNLRGSENLAGFCQLGLQGIFKSRSCLFCLFLFLFLSLLPRQSVLYLAGLQRCKEAWRVKRQETPTPTAFRPESLGCPCPGPCNCQPSPRRPGGVHCRQGRPCLQPAPSLAAAS